jgi:hypothetical protein
MPSPTAIAIDDAQLDATIATLEATLVQLRAMREVRAKPAVDDPAVPRLGRPGALPVNDWIELGEAAKRFGTRKDTLRNWCRVHGVGFKDGGRWLVSIRKVQERIDR